MSFVENTREALLVPVTVLPEADYMLTKRLGPWAARAMLRSVAADELRLEPLTAADLSRSLELMDTYADSTIGLVDASIVAIAERLGVTRILTLDRRHFRMFRPRHCAAFELVP
jgi:predicted nucleic acid-binding protein